MKHQLVKLQTCIPVIFVIMVLSLSCTTEKKEPFTFVQMCDTQLGFGAKGYQHDLNTFTQAVKQINDLNPDFVVICGDLIQDVGDTTAYADFKNIMSDFNMPCYPAPGNHDVSNDPTDTTIAFYRNTIGEDYYRVHNKGYEIVVTNTQLWKVNVENESQAHDKWFKNSLAELRESGTPLFVVGHYPLYINEPDEKELYYNLPPEKRKELLSLFKQSNVVAYLTGHTHKLLINNYEGIQLVSGETTSKNFDKRPFGYRVWNVSDDTIQHQFAPLEKYQLEE